MTDGGRGAADPRTTARPVSALAIALLMAVALGATMAGDAAAQVSCPNLTDGTGNAANAGNAYGDGVAGTCIAGSGSTTTGFNVTNFLSFGSVSFQVINGSTNPVIPMSCTGAGCGGINAFSERTCSPAAGSCSLSVSYSDTSSQTVTVTAFVAQGSTTVSNISATGGGFVPPDTTPPVATSIVVSGSPSPSATSVDFVVSFDENANNISTDDFSVATASGSATGAVTSVSASSGSSVTVTVGSISGEGSIRLFLNGFTNIVDDSGNGNGTNGAVASFTTGQTHTVDRVAPSVSSIAVSGSPVANSSSVDFLVTFDEAVVNVTADDFSVDGSGVTGTIGTPTGSGTSWTVPVNSVSGAGTLSIDLNSGTDIADAAGNSAPAAFTAGGAHTVDTVPPAVQAIALSQAYARTVTTINFDVFFNESALNVSADDFVLTAGGTATGTVGTPTGAGTSWSVPVTVTGGTGTLRLDFGANTNVVDTVGNGDGINGYVAARTGGSTHTVDLDPPTVVDVRRITPTSENITSSTTAVVFEVTFNEVIDAGSIDALGADFSTTTTGTLTGTISGVTVTGGASVRVTVGSLTGDGTLGVTFTGSVSDDDGNASTGTLTPSGLNETYTRDGTPPGVASITRLTPSGQLIGASASSVTFQVTFDEDVALASFGAGDLTPGGTAGGSILGVSQVSASTFNVGVGSFSADGTVSLSVTGSVSDSAGNASSGTLTPSGANETYIRDTTPPAGYSAQIDMLGESLINTINQTIIEFAGTGLEAGSTLNYSFTSSGGGTPVSGTETVTSSSQTFDNGGPGYDLSGLGDGQVTLTVTLTDPAGNTGSSVTDAETKDALAPSGYSVAFTQGLINSTNETAVGLQISNGQPGATYAYWIISSGGGSPVTGSGSMTGTSTAVSGIDVSGLADGTLMVSLSLTDGAGGGPAVTSTVVKAAVPHTLTAIVRNTPTTAGTSDDTLVFGITFSGIVVNVTADDFTITGTTATGVIAGSGSSYTLTVSGGDLANLNGTVGLDLAASQDIEDASGNPLPAGEPPTDQVYFVSNDVTPPSVATVTFSGGAPNAASVTYTYTFDEPAVNVSANDFIVTTTSGSATGSVSAVSGSGDTYVVTVGSLSGTGGIRLDLNANTDIQDGSGNGNGVNGFVGGFSSAGVHVVDLDPPAGYAVAFGQSSYTTGQFTSVSVDVTGGEVGATYSLTISSSGGGAPVFSNGTLTAVNETISGLDLSGLADGTLTAALTLTDPASNAGSAVTGFANKAAATPPTLALAFAPSTIAPGGVTTATYTLDNAANTVAATSVDFGHILSAGLSVANPANASTTCTGGTLTASPGSTSVDYLSGTVPAGSSCTVSVNLTASAPGSYTETTSGLFTSLGNGAAASSTVSVGAFPTLSIGSIAVNENAGSASLTVTLSAVSAQTVTVQYATSDATAIDGGDYTATSGTLTYTPGQTNRTVTVPLLDDAVAEGSETFSVSLSSPSNATIAPGAGVVTITDDDAASVTIADVSGNEDDGAITLTATLDVAVQGGFTVYVATTDGSATAGVDYVGFIGQSLAFAGTAGETQTFTVTPIVDSTPEGNESLTVSMSNFSSPSSAASVDITDAATVTLVDDDLPGLSINDITVAEGAGVATFLVSANVPGVIDGTFDITVSNGTAADGVDFDASLVSGVTSLFPSNTSAVLINVPLLDDALNENPETFTVTLSNPVGVTLIDPAGEATITDDDSPPAVSINDVTVAEGDSGTTSFDFTVSLNAPSGRSVSVIADTADGSAAAGSDYTAVTSQTVTFAPGQTSATVSVLVSGDTTAESNETFTVNLSGPVNATISGAAGTGTITDDDTVPTGYSVAFGQALYNAAAIGSASLDVTGAQIGATYNYTITDAGSGAVTGSGSVTSTAFSITGIDLSALADGPLSASLTLTDTIGTGPQATATASKVTDPPVLVSIERQTPAAALTNQASVTFRVSFDRAMAFLDINAFTLGGTITGARVDGVTAVSANAYDVDIDSYTGEGTLSIQLTGVAQDTNGNVTNGAQTPTGADEAYTIDLVAPGLTSITRSNPAGQAIGASTTAVVFLVTFDEALDPTTLAVTDFTVGGGVGGSVSGLSQITPSTYEVTVQSFTGDGTVSLALSGDVDDPAGNTASAPVAGTSEGYTRDTTAPAGYSVAFDQPVYNAATASSASLNVSGAEVGATYDYTISDSGSGTVSGSGAVTAAGFSVTGIDLSALTDGALTASLTLTDANALTGAAQTDAAVLDQTAPAPVISVVSGTQSGPVTATISFGETVSGFDLSDVAVSSNATLSSLVDQGGGQYTVLVTPSVTGSFAVTLDVLAAAASDGAGNPNLAASQSSIAYLIDATAPNLTAVVLSSDNGDPTQAAIGDAITVAITADEALATPPTVLIAGEAATVTGAGVNWSGSITAGPTTTEGAASILITGYADAVGNVGSAVTSATSGSVTIDRTAPGVVVATSASSTVNGQFDITITFSEAVTGFDTSDLSLVNATASNFSAVSASEYAVTLTPSADGPVTLDIPAGVAADAASNVNTAAAQLAVTADLTAPGVVLATTAANLVTGPFDVTITFSEDVTGFESADLVVSNATLSGFSASSPSGYLVTLTPSADGPVTVDIPAGVAADDAANGNTAAQQLSVTADLTAPALTVSAPVSSTGPFSVEFAFSEPVIDFDASDISVVNGAVTSFSGAGAVFSAVIAPSTVGDVVVAVGAGAASDAAGNLSAGGGATTQARSEAQGAISLALDTSVVDPGDVAGSFNITNPGGAGLTFSASADVSWLDVAPQSGTVPSFGTLPITITLNDQADLLSPGVYTGTVTAVVAGAASPAGAASAAAAPGSTLVSVPVTLTVTARYGTVEIIAATPGGVASQASFGYSSDAAPFEGLTLSVTAGQASSGAQSLLAGAYTVTQTSVPAGWRLESLSCTGDADAATQVSVQDGAAVIDLDPTEAIVCTFENARDEDAVRLATQRAIYNFMARRADRIVEAAPDLSRRFSDRDAVERGAFSADVDGSGRYQMALGGSLSGLRNAAAADTPAIAGVTSYERPFMEGWDVWFAAAMSGVRDDRAGERAESDFAVAQLGVDYQLSQGLILGVLAQYDWMEETAGEVFEEAGGVAGARVEGQGWMAGPYAVWRIRDALILDALAMYGRSDNQVDPLDLYEDDFETDRMMLRASLTGEFRSQSGVWRLRPQAGLTHFEETQNAYTDSLGFVIPEQTVTLGRFRAGPEVVWRHSGDRGGWIEVSTALNAVWDYSPAELLNEAGLLTGGDDAVRADARVGLSALTRWGAIIRFETGFDGLGVGNFEARTGRFEIRIPFGASGGGGIARTGGVAGVSSDEGCSDIHAGYALAAMGQDRCQTELR